MASFMHIGPALIPPLDPGFVSAELWNRAYRARCDGDPGAQALAIALERTDGPTTCRSAPVSGTTT